MVIEKAGQRYEILDWPGSQREIEWARQEIETVLQPRDFDRYESPFEAKLTLRDKTAALPEAVGGILRKLESNDWCERISKMFGVEVVADRWRHYAGVFRYLPDDHLGVHVDAAIHPISKLRKHITLVLYFGAGAGPLELWAGTSCVAEDGDPIVTDLIESVEPAAGRIVAFECNDYAWHAAARNTHPSDDRLVLTVSYLSAVTFPYGNMQNQRTRAFFVPRPTEEWSPETYALRDLRADPERYAEAYRA